MRNEARDRDDARGIALQKIRQSCAGQLMERGRHYRQRPLEPIARQVAKAAAIGKARCMHHRIDAAERSPRRGNEVRRVACRGEVAAMESHIGPGLSARLRDRLEPHQPGRISALAVQHESLSRPGEAARNGGTDPGTASGND
ncbi:hypothetical protein S58_36430 [Bradyrhizobium oligotrophicum S58]|uniref:Uncharacterized protein n=1 Tax=Bradyrhizobium oligotrophicum S58 TaxID=1245469 RepID=M4Z8U0_9BRAD|nr:hypothetical protein S58_36430 [Bradyrhizobium oligotrophicum S58]